MDNKLSKEAYGGVDGYKYVPYVSTGDKKGGNPVILIAGILLAILFAASTAYSGMKSGLTVAAGIPGAIIGSAIVGAFAKKKGVFGKNILQGMSSGGETIASGVIFVLPAVLLIGAELTFFEASLVGIAGALFGIGVSTIVHEFLLIEEHGKLMYPESMAIAETVVASEGAGESLKFMGIGFGISGLITLVTGSVLGLVNNVISYVNNKGYMYKYETEVSPMLLGIGYIVGWEVSFLMLAGSVLANFAVLPLIGYFSALADPSIMVWNNSNVAVNAMTVGNISGSYLRYMGAGMMLSGGIIGAVRLIPTIITSLKKTLSKNNTKGTDASNVGKIILILGLVISIIMSFILSGGNIVMAIIIGLLSLLLSFIFIIVSGRLTGTIGTSNLPVSGMTIAALVIVTLVFLVMNWKSAGDNKTLLLFGTFIVTAISMAGGYTQSQKVGFILGADKDENTKYLSLAAVIGVLTVVGVIILLKDKLVAVTNPEFALPQANLMATLTQGIISGNLPWTMIIVGIIIGIFFWFCGLPIMTVSLGFYLPIATSSIIFFGALLRVIFERTAKSTEDKEAKVSNGISLSAGLVAGSSIIGLIGIILQVSEVIKLGEIKGFASTNTMAWILLAILIISVSLVLVNAGVKNNGKKK